MRYLGVYPSEKDVVEKILPDVRVQCMFVCVFELLEG